VYTLEGFELGEERIQGSEKFKGCARGEIKDRWERKT